MKVEDLKREREENANVSYQEFAKLVREFPADLMCFFENKDDSYYYSRIKTVVENYHSIRCEGKDKVLKVHQLISYHREYDKYKKAFFVDRDFNTPLSAQNPPIFETPCYSIENFYVSATTFKEILKYQLSISELSDTFKTCMQLFIDRQKEFHQAVCLFNAWYACLITLKEQTKKDKGENLDLQTNLVEKLPKDFVLFSLQSIAKNYDIDKIKATFPKSPEIPLENLDNKILELENCEQSKVFRGKYELRFVIDLINAIIKDANDKQFYIKEKLTFNFGNIGIDRALQIFSPYAETPESLTEYLKEVTKV